MASWPFSNAELTAGLRRYFAEPTLRVESLEAAPDRQGGRGLRVAYQVGGERLHIDCVLKEPHGAARPGLAHPGVREAGLYRSLAGQLPMATPTLIAADPGGAWLVLEAVEASRPAPGAWQARDYEQAVVLLAQLHERFWGLADDLAAYPWLARPLTLDYEIHVYAAAHALGRLVRDEWPPLIAQSAEVLAWLGRIISQAERVVAPLRALPFTLLHGYFWQGNLLRDDEGDWVVLGWNLAAIGPGVLDLLVMVVANRWEHGDLPLPEADLTGLYREELARRVGVRWTDDEWQRLWDHALLWRFVQERLTWLASVSPEAFAARAERFDQVWLRPVLQAAARRLDPL